MADEKLIVELYETGRCPSEIARIVGFSRGDTVVRILKKLGKHRIDGPTGYCGNSNSRKYIVNSNYFSVIDTEEKAYWLGFLYADGYNTNKYRITINLQWADREHLELLKKHIGSNHPIVKRIVKIKKMNEVARLDINCRKFCVDLTRHGMVKAKSLILAWPDSLDDELKRHFVRGYFDGDGSVGESKTAVCTFSFCSSEFFINSLKKYLMKNLKLNDNSLCLSGKARSVRWSGYKPSLAFYNFLYQGSTVFLTRKKEKFEKLLTLQEKSIQLEA